MTSEARRNEAQPLVSVMMTSSSLLLLFPFLSVGFLLPGDNLTVGTRKLCVINGSGHFDIDTQLFGEGGVVV